MLKKRISIIERRSDLTPEQFDAHWAGPHVPIVRSLPGIRYYVQHHLVGDQVAVRAAGLDGIAEVVYDAPPEQASNTHFSPAQADDEKSFVRAMTGIPIVDPIVEFAPYSVWVVAHTALEPSALDVLGTSRVSAERRVPTEPVIRRDFLESEADAAEVYLVARFDTLPEAQAAYAILDGAAGIGGIPRSECRVVLTESIRQV